jgi:hypothetical protein
MNRSILIVICDFLLVSLLAFSTVDINKVADEGIPRTAKFEIVTNQVDSGKDLAAVMRLALDEERRGRDMLVGELNRTREAAAHQQSLLGEKEKLLTDKEKQLQTFQQDLQTRDQQAARLQQELQTKEQQAARLQQDLQTKEQQSALLKQLQASLEQQYATAQTNIQNLSQQLQNTSVEAILSKEKLAAMQADLANLQQSNQLVLAEKQRLAGELQVAEIERRHASEQAVAMQEQVKVERAEKARLAEQATQLAEGVKVLANKSGELAQEVRDNRPLAPNTIFSDFSTNRVAARFDAVRPGFLGEAERRRETQTILVTDGTNTFALCHVQDTPLTLSNPGTDWDTLTGNFNRGGKDFPIRSLIFSLRDPRIVLMPVTAAQASELGCRVYRISSEPYKFQDAVLVGAREGYYGECRFQLDLTTPEYVKLDRSFLKGLFGKFNPSRGDLVFSKTGELLGIMANSTYCMMIRSCDGAAAFVFAPDIRDQHTGVVLASLSSMVSSLPLKLQ